MSLEMFERSTDRTFSTETLTITADASGVDFTDVRILGSVLYCVELKTTLDDAITFSMNTATGAQIFTKTTTAATGGEIGYPPMLYPIHEMPKYTVSGLGSGSLTVKVTFWYR